MNVPDAQLSFSNYISPDEIVRLAGLQRWYQGEQHYLVIATLESSASAEAFVPDGFDIHLWAESSNGADVFASRGEVSITVDWNRERVVVHVAATTRAAATAIADDVRAVAALARKPGTRIRRWMLKDLRPFRTDRTLATPAWADIARNYPTPVRERLAAIMALREPSGGGKLLLWHGEPGTGKTTAIRALAAEWEPWCEVHYIADPERLFSESSYLTHVATTDGGGVAHDGEARRWRVIVAEDTDEYLRPSARRDAGASLGRLLNLSDGLLGQGLDVLILLTTNEDIGRLHPAVTRPGRCLAEVAFRPFTAAEASRWLERPARKPMTLAELLEARGDLAVMTTSEPAAVTGQYL